MRSPREARGDEHLIESVTRLGRRWSRPSRAETVSIRFSSRLSKTWALTNLVTNTITLSSELNGDRERLDDVLCHELAHVVSHERVGRTEGPRGPPWRRLVLDEGRDPPVADRNATTTKANGVTRPSLHLPVCDFSRIVRRRRGAPSSDSRSVSLESLAAGELKIVFAVDMFNEGVDVPAIDTVMMLGPTESQILRVDSDRLPGPRWKRCVCDGRLRTGGSMPMAEQEPWASVEDVARHLGIVKDTVYRGSSPRRFPLTGSGGSGSSSSARSTSGCAAAARQKASATNMPVEEKSE